MSVLIKGMEMPVTCCHCPLMGYDPDIEWNDGGRETQGAYICVITHELIDNTKREEHCPLIHVPPHGDLVDRDEMREIAISLLNEAVTDQEANAIRKMWSRLGQMPVCIPAEEGE